MNILYFSDVHIEIRDNAGLPTWTDTLPLGHGPELAQFVGSTDLVVLAGDIGRVQSRRTFPR